MTKLLLTIATLTGLLISCGDSADPLPDAPVATVTTVEVTAPATTIESGATLQLAAVLRDEYGAAVSGYPIAWTTSDPALAIVSDAGLVTARSAGPVVISAISEGKSGAVSLTVRDGAGAVAVITVSPSGEVWLDPGATVQVLATTYDAGGQIVTGREVTWTSDAAVATVSASGLVTAVTSGATWITAICEDQTDDMLVRVYSAAAVDHVTLSHSDEVLGINQTLQLHAQPRDVANQPVNRLVTWESDAPDVATVDANGLVTTHSDGSALIIATSDGVWATMFVWVSPP